MNILLDTNVILDHLLDRQPFAKNSALILNQIEHASDSGFLCATTITTIDYLIKKVLGKKEAKLILTDLLNLFEIAAVNRVVIENALNNKFIDFEDAVLHESAKHLNLDAIITRNIEDFKRASIPVYLPHEFIIAKSF